MTTDYLKDIKRSSSSDGSDVKRPASEWIKDIRPRVISKYTKNDRMWTKQERIKAGDVLFDPIGRGWAWETDKKTRKFVLRRLSDTEIRKLPKGDLPSPPGYVDPIVEIDPITKVKKVVGPWGIGFPVPPKRITSKTSCVTILADLISASNQLRKSTKLTFPKTDVERRKRGEIVSRIVERGKELAAMECKIIGTTEGEVKSKIQSRAKKIAEDPSLMEKIPREKCIKEFFYDYTKEAVKKRFEDLEGGKSVTIEDDDIVMVDI